MTDSEETCLASSPCVTSSSPALTSRQRFHGLARSTSTPPNSHEEVAAVLAKYNLLALPVTDAEDHMLGIVTVDDAIESVIPGAWKRRLPRVFG